MCYRSEFAVLARTDWPLMAAFDTTTTRADASALAHLPPLDGLRGIAIGAVLVHHLWRDQPNDPWGWLVESGWIGVDLFFVLSGFLITRILLATKDRPDYFRAFYARRTLRIFPLYYATVALVAILLPALGVIGQQAAPAGLWLVLAYLQNYAPESLLALSGSMLAITWSLCIEEQFYLFWPWLVRRCGPQRLRCLALGGCVLALAVRVGVRMIDPAYSGAFRWLPARLDALLAGALLAITFHRDARLSQLRRSLPYVTLASLAGIAVIGFFEGRFYFRDPLAGTLGMSLVAGLATAALAYAFVLPTDHVYLRLLCSRPLRLLGKYSYGIYLLHSPAAGAVARLARRLPAPLVDTHQLLGRTTFFALALALTLLVCQLSWHLLERPFLALKARWPSAPRRAP
jgi:peptidoglycan/LPS O-acetylase OafA/YrhL